jgi:predicted transcriptional regulator
MAQTEALSRRERQIMEVIWSRGSATAAQVVDQIADPPSKTAVRTLLTILERKGHLKHVKSGREFVYSPQLTRARAAKSALKKLLHTFFSGSLERAVAARLAETSDPLDDDELQRIIAMIEEAKKRRR